MKKIMKILKGSLVGLGGILPGVSGGMIAASFNVYEELIEALNNVTKTPIKAVLSIWEYLIGIALGVLVGVVVIATVFKLFPIPITLLFIGLILGGVPDIVKKVKVEKLNWKHYLITGVLMVIMILLLFTKQMTEANLGYFQYILAGFLIALSLIVPGLSGTMILLALGIYDFIMVGTISGFITAVFSFNFNEIFNLLPQIIVIGLSGLLSLVLLAKPINYLVKNKQTYFNMAILGILFVSPINILWSLRQDEKYSSSFDSINIWIILSSLILLVLGFYLAIKLGQESKVGDDLLDV